ncbi:MAG: GMC family oxidoreductase, partial [Bacteroidota bacterium]
MRKFYYNEEQASYDAIVVGTGMSGGWAAKELTEKGLKTLILERGRMIRHVVDYDTANLEPWDMPNAGAATKEILARQPKQSRTSR